MQPHLGPRSIPVCFLFYQVIYPLKEIYPDSGELSLLEACPPTSVVPTLLTVPFGRVSPPRLLGSTVYCLGACTLTSSCFVFPSWRRVPARGREVIASFTWPCPY